MALQPRFELGVNLGEVNRGSPRTVTSMAESLGLQTKDKPNTGLGFLTFFPDGQKTAEL